jgi:hypothetical protein
LKVIKVIKVIRVMTMTKAANFAAAGRSIVVTGT